jgi:hypothetical protein
MSISFALKLDHATKDSGSFARGQQFHQDVVQHEAELVRYMEMTR